MPCFLNTVTTKGSVYCPGMTTVVTCEALPVGL